MISNNIRQKSVSSGRFIIGFPNLPLPDPPFASSGKNVYDTAVIFRKNRTISMRNGGGSGRAEWLWAGAGGRSRVQELPVFTGNLLSWLEPDKESEPDE